MAKRISRRELKEKIQYQKNQLDIVENNLDDMRNERDTLKRRIMELGSKAEPYDVHGGVECIEIEPQGWGQYTAVSLLDDITDDEICRIKDELAKSMARGLMEKELVQFVIRDDAFISGYMTIGARLYVVPWEKVTRRIVMNVGDMSIKDDGEKDP